MPKGEEERRKSETEEEASSKSERKTSVESSAGSTLEDRDRKESVSSAKLTGSFLSIESIVTEETGILSDIKLPEIQTSETLQGELSASGLLQPPAPEKTKVSPVKEFFSNIAQKFHLKTPSKKSPPKISPEIEQYVPGQELMEDCLVKLPLKDKKTQTEKLTETRNITPRKRAASFLSPETYEEVETSTSRSTTADERDLITPSPTPRLDESKMTLAITGFEPAKPVPGPFQKLRKLIGLEKEEKPMISHQTAVKCEPETEAKSTQTASIPMSAITMEGVLVLKDLNRGWASAISTSESVDYTEWSQGTSEHSMDCISSMNADTSGSSPVEVEAVSSSLTGSEESLQLKFERANIGKKPMSKKMPNPVLEMLKHEKTEDIEDEATSKSPRKKESEDNLSKSPSSFQKQDIVSETFFTATNRDEVNVDEIYEASGSAAESNVRDTLDPSLKIVTEEMNVEESSNEGSKSCGSVGEPDMKDLSISKSPGEKMNVEEASKEAECMAAKADKNVSISENQDKELNVENISKEADSMDTHSDKKDLSTSKSRNEQMNVEENSKEACDAAARVFQSDVTLSIVKDLGEEKTIQKTSKETKEACGGVSQSDVKDLSISTSTSDKTKVEVTFKENKSVVTESNKNDLQISLSCGIGMNVAEISKEAETLVVEADEKDFSISEQSVQFNVEEYSKQANEASSMIAEPENLFPVSKGLDEEASEVCGSLSKTDENDLSISTNRCKEKNVEEVSSEEALVSESDKKLLSKSEGEEMSEEENSKESGKVHSKVTSKDISLLISRSPDKEVNTEKTTNEADETADKVAESDISSTISYNQEEMNIEGTAKVSSETTGTVTQSSILYSILTGQDVKMNVGYASTGASEATGRVAELITLFSSSTSTDEEKTAAEASKKTSEAAGSVAQSDASLSISTSQGEEMNVAEASEKIGEAVGSDAQLDASLSILTSQDETMSIEEAVQESSEADGKVTESDLKHISSVGISLDEQMDTS
ncbi:uncharacterized protein LOC129225026 [Uloborus diversus]|uniref:uncharacterized protein LOC129225026 n=1 Tax=Uloborus diversus TaxID=327109 RepID=UPI00240996EE|nr:uncharacterized protein LOC129225026 [Uloborus diversus]